MEFPKVVKIRQKFSGPQIVDIPAAVTGELNRMRLSEKVKPGMRVAVTAGSRGIANINLILRSVIRELKRYGAEPFIIPAMGSHGGATAEGQREVLESLGITESYCEAPILSSMDVVQIGKTEDGMPVHVDRYAWEADGVVLVGRIKSHTDFKSNIESGIMKMASIGIGKHKQALLIHSYGVRGLRDMMPKVAEVVLEKMNVLFALAVVENAYDQTAIIEAMEKEDIRRREEELLKEAARLMPSLPVKELDVLVVDEIGKNYSGTGMDTNIIGRLRILGVEEPETPKIKYILVSDLSEASHGNALGIGLADITTKRLFEKIDFQSMNENVITSTFLSRAAIPIVLENDREALKVAFRVNWGVAPENTRLIRIPNTLHLETMYVSEALLGEIKERSDVEILGEPEPMRFDENGYFFKSDFHVYHD